MKVVIEKDGTFIGITNAGPRNEPCLVIKSGSRTDIVAKFTTPMAADRFAELFLEILKEGLNG